MSLSSTPANDPGRLKPCEGPCGLYDCVCDKTPRGVVVADAVEAALKSGSSYVLALALRDFVANAVVQHSAAMGRPVSDAVALAIAGNASMPLADWMRR